MYFRGLVWGVVRGSASVRVVRGLIPPDRSFILAFDVAQNLSLPRGVGFGAPFPCPSVYFRGLVWGGVGVRVRPRGPRFNPRVG